MDLFAHSAPAYGSLTHEAETALYLNDRAGWLAYVAGAMGQKLLRGGADAIRQAWRFMPEDYRTAVLDTLTVEQRVLVRRAGAPLPEAAPE